MGKRMTLKKRKYKKRQTRHLRKSKRQSVRKRTKRILRRRSKGGGDPLGGVSPPTQEEMKQGQQVTYYKATKNLLPKVGVNNYYQEAEKHIPRPAGEDAKLTVEDLKYKGPRTIYLAKNGSGASGSSETGYRIVRRKGGMFGKEFKQIFLNNDTECVIHDFNGVNVLVVTMWPHGDHRVDHYIFKFANSRDVEDFRKRVCAKGVKCKSSPETNATAAAAGSHEHEKFLMQMGLRETST